MKELSTKTASIASGRSELFQKVRDYQQLVKLRLNLTVVFSSLMAYLIGASGPIDWIALLVLALGGFLVTGAANTLNQVLESEFDANMKRTADRPLAAGRMKSSEAVMAAGMMSMFGITLLALFNPWTAFFGTLALVLYAFLYTPMKRISPLAVTIGAVPGALPTLIGVVAAQGTITTLGITLFFIQFLWQFPHFWSIGWLGFEDYKKAGYKIMPERNGQQDPNIAFQALLYALFLIPVSFVPFYLGETGIVSMISLLVLSVLYAVFAFIFYKKQNRKAALGLMFYSFCYIPFGLIVLFL
ncbi:MAG: heme o synthase, partial [Bacteroidota bacterium]